MSHGKIAITVIMSNGEQRFGFHVIGIRHRGVKRGCVKAVGCIYTHHERRFAER